MQGHSSSRHQRNEGKECLLVRSKKIILPVNLTRETHARWTNQGYEEVTIEGMLVSCSLCRISRTVWEVRFPARLLVGSHESGSAVARWHASYCICTCYAAEALYPKGNLSWIEPWVRAIYVQVTTLWIWEWVRWFHRPRRVVQTAQVRYSASSPSCS